MPSATAVTGPDPATTPAPAPSFGKLAGRWYRLNQDRLRAVAIGAISLAAFLIVWHLLTTYRVVFFVRFTNVPSPLAVYASFTKAIHDPQFLMHLLLSCRRIFIGFSLAAIVAVPLDAKTDAEITMLANLITVTPGSFSLEVSADRSVLYVHAMYVDDPETFRREIKNGFERRVLELLR